MSFYVRAGKVFLGTTVIATGVVIGGIYYANVDPKFRQTIEDRVPYSSALFNAVLGKSEQKPKTVPKKASVRHLLCTLSFIDLSMVHIVLRYLKQLSYNNFF